MKESDGSSFRMNHKSANLKDSSSQAQFDLLKDARGHVEGNKDRAGTAVHS